jgi:hypothetical protein
VLVPMVVKEKVSGAVYADATITDAGRFDSESIAFLTFLAGLFVDRLAGRKLKPAPALRPLGGLSQTAPEPAFESEPERPVEQAPYGEDSESRPGARESFGTKILSMDSMAAADVAEPPVPPPPPPPSAPHIPADVPTPPPPPRFSEPAFAPPERTATPVLEPEPALEPEPQESESSSPEPSLAYEPDAESSSPRRAPRGAAERPAPAPSPAAAPAPAPPPSAPAPAEVAPLRPTAGARRLAGPLAPLEGDERREEARRFAKLLVSEIKLYNEKVVLEGRQNGNLYDRLKEDIDRSRQMYDERIPEDVRANTNFFYEELVRILADGRAEALGI